MSKIVSKFTLTAGLMLAMVLTFIGCSERAQTQPNSEQSDNKQSHSEQLNEEQRLLGTWVDEADGAIWVFNSDRTGTQEGNKSLGKTFKYGVTSDKLAIIIYERGGEYTRGRTKTYVLDLSISNDGKTAILTTALAEGFLFRKKAVAEAAEEAAKAKAEAEAMDETAKAKAAAEAAAAKAAAKAAAEAAAEAAAAEAAR